MPEEYAGLKNKKNELIRKSLEGSVFIADMDSDPIAKLTEYAAGPPPTVGLKPLPEGWDDLGWLTGDGAAFSRDVAQAETTSWGSVTPTRTDVTADSSTLSFTAQETKLLTIGLATGADLKNAKADFRTGEFDVKKPARASARRYRALSLGVDVGDGGEIYVARFLPAAKVTNYAEQNFNGDSEITWGVTLTGEEDSELGYSERWIFGGPGWLALLDEMGIEQATA